MERKASCHVANAFLGRLKVIWPISSQKISEIFKTAVFLAESSGSQMVNIASGESLRESISGRLDGKREAAAVTKTRGPVENHLSIINTERTMRRTLGVSCDSSRIYTERVFFCWLLVTRCSFSG